MFFLAKRVWYMMCHVSGHVTVNINTHIRKGCKQCCTVRSALILDIVWPDNTVNIFQG